MNRTLYPPLKPTRCGKLQVSACHTLYWEESGDPLGLPVVVLHGGPGAGTVPEHRQFFDPQQYRILMFDQRGSGKSMPTGETSENTTALLIEDIERLREMWGVDSWLLFGGSWGSTLALAYGQAFPRRCRGFVLRGVFLCSQAEIDWWLMGARWFHPEAHEQFVSSVGAGDDVDLLQVYLKHIHDKDRAIHMAAARAWTKYESGRVHLADDGDAYCEDATAFAIARLESSYMANLGFMSDGQLLGHLDRISHLPACIVQGRYDVVCPPLSAYRLHRRWNGSVLKIIANAGHSAFEPGIASALVEATDQFWRTESFGQG